MGPRPEGPQSPLCLSREVVVMISSRQVAIPNRSSNEMLRCRVEVVSRISFDVRWITYVVHIHKSMVLCC